MKKTIFIACFVVALLGISGSVFAQSIGFRGVGGRLSFVDPDGTSGTLGVGAHADLGILANNLILYPGIEYWAKNGFNQIAINGDMRYYPSNSANLKAFAGGGVAFIFNEGDLNLGLDLLGGVDFPIADKLLLNTEVRFVLSDINVIKLSGGLTYLFGN